MRPLFLLSILLPAAVARAGGTPVDFNRDIRPLLSRHCTACHGGVKAAGDISFVYRERALAEGASGQRAIVPGRPEDSEVLRRVTTDDPDDLMPRPDHGPRLTEAEITLLRDWITQGAAWSEHWAFVPPVEPADPAPRAADWPRGKLDRLVLARLESSDLSPAPEATPAEWLRRVSLDLTGLPPSLADYEAFVADSAPDAREKVVDRLLASPHFGERWASVWLDLARYSDTYGFEKDPHRDIWPWRDWVIRAFNDDQPFDRFTVLQLAGDLLPDGGADAWLATAFHRNTQNNTEGGTDDEEFRTAAVLDRVNTTWTAWNATTFGCVQCHAHPYDPIPHADYFRFMALFNNAEDTDLNDDFPRLRVPEDAEKRSRAAELERTVRARREALNASGVALAATSAGWTSWRPTQAKPSSGALAVDAAGEIRATGTLPRGVTYTLEGDLPSGATALRLDIRPDQDDPTQWPERGSVLSQLTVEVVTGGGTATPVRVSEVVADYLAGPFDPSRTTDKDADGFGSFPVLAGPRWCVVVLESPLPAAQPGDRLRLVLRHAATSNSGTQATPLRRFTWNVSTEPRWTQWAAAPERATAWQEMEGLKKELNALGGTRVPVLVERAEAARRDTRLFIRGNRQDLGESVSPGLPEVFNPPGGTEPLDRLRYAEWLVGPEHPLTARVLANRLWAELFGIGIVETQEDFGSSGARPTHPALLDHLALRLRDTYRWSIKAFLREVALSRTYGQSARVTPEALERDPHNRMLARGPRQRLTAEMVRDHALAVSGLLEPKMFGPPVFPPQPDGIWSSAYSGATWKTSQGPDRHRRAIYTYRKRTSGYPGFLTFDAPTGDACSARRLPTNTPLQALVTLNDPAHLEFARALAGVMSAAGSDARAAIAVAARRLTLAPPADALLDTLVKLHAEAAADFRSDDAARAHWGDTPEAAAYVLVANTLLNLDLALVR
jgi:hypothetical protein